MEGATWKVADPGTREVIYKGVKMNQQSTPPHESENLEDEIGSVAEINPQQAEEWSIQNEAQSEEPDLTAMFEPIYGKLDKLQSTFDEWLTETTSQSDLIKLLHADMSKYREEFWFKHTTSRLINDLLRFYDKLSQTLLTENIDNMSKEALINRLQRFQKELLKILSRQDVEPIKAEHGIPFNEAIHDAVDTKPVTTEAEAGQVARILQDGFTYRQKLLRPQKVIVTQYQTQEQTEEQS